MAPAIRQGLHVDPRDSLRSLVVRACRRRHLPHTWIIGSRVGLVHRNRADFAEHPNVDVAELARLLEVPVEAVAERRHERIDNDRIDYWGLAVPSSLMETAHRRRFAPGAFGAGIATPIHDTRWDMRLLPFCASSWQMLEERCGCCGRVQMWTVANGVDRCDNLRCVASLSKTVARPIAPELQASLRLAAQICSSSTDERQVGLGRLSGLPGLTDQQAFDLLALLVTLARASRKIVRTAGPSIDQADMLEGVVDACQIMLDWPHALLRIATTASRAEPAVRAAFIGRVRNLGTTPDGAIPAAIMSMIVDTLGSSRSRATSAAPASELALPTPAYVPDAIVGVRPASEAAGTARDTLETAWADGLVTRHYRSHGARRRPAFSLREAIALGAALRARTSASAAAYRLGLPLYAIEQLISLGMLSADAVRMSTDWDLRFLLKCDLAAFAERVQAAPASPADAVALTEVLTAVPGRKPWGPAIRSLLEGAPYRIAEGDGPLFHRVHVDRADAAGIRAMTFDHDAGPEAFSPEAVLGDALEVLGLSWKHDAVVLKKPILGRMPKRVAMADIVDLAATYVSTAEIAARTEMPPSKAARLLKRAGLSQPHPGCWLRLEAERVLEEIVLKY